jgi:hypothetical protein
LFFADTRREVVDGAGNTWSGLLPLLKMTAGLIYNVGSQAIFCSIGNRKIGGCQVASKWCGRRGSLVVVWTVEGVRVETTFVSWE